MSSAIGDLTQNPAVNKDNPNDSGIMNKLGIALSGAAEGASYLPDAISNLLSTSNLVPNPFSWQASSPDAMRKQMQSPAWGKDPLARALTSVGIINPNLQKKTYADKAIYEGSKFAGGLATPLGATGKIADIVSGPALGAIAATGAASPTIQESNASPLVKTAADLGVSVLGGIAGAPLAKLGKYLAGKSPQLPEYTAAQNLAADDPQTAILKNKQMDLLNSDPKAAVAMQGILKNRQQKMADMLKSPTPVSGDDIAQQIEQAFSDKITQRAKNYDDLSSQIFADTSKPVNIDSTVNALGQAQASIPKLGGGRTTPLEKGINDAFDLITNNSNDPMRLKGVLSELQQMANPAGPLQLSSQQSAIFRPVINALRTDIDNAYPGFKNLNTQYANDTNALEELKDGVVGKIDKKSGINPSQVFNQIFEKTDPARTQQIQDILGPDLYKQAAQTYLEGTGNKILTPTNASTANNNPSPQISQLGDYLRTRQDQLSQTLPPEQQALVNSLINQSERGTRGVPSGDFLGQALNTPNNPVSAMMDYNKNILPYAMDILKNTGGKQSLNALRRNQMLTGQTPIEQILSASLPGASGAISMNQPPPAPIQSQMGQGVQQAAPTSPAPNIQPTPPQAVMPIPQSWNQKLSQNSALPGGFSDFDQKYGVPQAQQPSNSGAMPNSFAEFDQKYGMNGTPPSTAQNGVQNIKTPQNMGAMPTDFYSYANKRLQAGDDSVLYNPQQSYDAYKAGSSPYSPEFLDKVKKIIASRESAGSGDYGAQSPNSSAIGKYQFINDTRNREMPGVSREDFLASPDLQEQAMNNLLSDNMKTFKNMGVDPNTVAPDDLAGMLAAAHLRGPNAAVQAYKNINYQGDPDANGTLPRNYFDYAKKAYDSAQAPNDVDFHSMNSDQLLNYANNFMPTAPQGIPQGVPQGLDMEEEGDNA